MGSYDQSFKLEVDVDDDIIGDMLTATCKRIDFYQSTSNAPSWAELTFYIKSSYNGQYIADVVPKYLAKNSDIRFQIFSLSDEYQTLYHNHVFVDYEVTYSMAGATYTLKLVTQEKLKVDMKLVEKSRAHKYDSLSDLVNAVVSENGGTMILTENTLKIKEFGTLIQPYMTDYDFIVDQVNARAISENSGGAYRLFTTDGLQAIYSTVGYNAKDISVPKEMILSSKPQRNAQWVAESGSVLSTGIGFNLDKKEAVTKYASKVAPSYGTLDIPKMYSKSKAYSFVPFFKEDSVNAVSTRKKYLEAYAAFPFVVSIRGSKGWDNVPYNVKIPILHDQGGGELRGYPTMIHHYYSNGEYRINLHCLRDKGQSL